LTIGTNKAKLDDVRSLDKIKSYFIITNVETMRDEKIVAELQNQCKAGNINMIAIDECHKVKNPTSQQGKGVLKLQAKYKIAMTGTPLMNTPFDLFIILKWLGYEKHSFYQFKNHYGVFGGYGGYQLINYRYLDELKTQLDAIMLRRLKNETLDLPEKTHITEYVEMTAKQAQIYKEMMGSVLANIDKVKESNNPLSDLIRLRQATGYTGILSSTIKESAKLDRMEELVEEAVANGKQVVIFSNWTQMTDAIYDRLHKKYTLSVITGQTADDLRQHNVNEFQSGRSKVMIGTIGAMGTGLTLTAGTVEIFMDEPWNRANKEQAEDRCHRVGTKENVTIYTLVCKNTIDERINELVEKKGKLADILVDGKVEDKTALVDFLIS
jgi:SNF2 family DNA or RNA helicase